MKWDVTKTTGIIIFLFALIIIGTMIISVLPVSDSNWTIIAVKILVKITLLVIPVVVFLIMAGYVIVGGIVWIHSDFIPTLFPKLAGNRVIKYVIWLLFLLAVAYAAKCNAGIILKKLVPEWLDLQSIIEKISR